MPKMVVQPTGKRVALNMKASEELRAQLEAAARVSGRSLTAEVEARVRQSFEFEKAFIDARTYLATQMAEVDAVARQQREAHERLARQKALGGGFVDPATLKPEDAVMTLTANDLRKLINEVLDAREAARVTPRKRA
jgi:hypothetical protein